MPEPAIWAALIAALTAALAGGAVLAVRLWRRALKAEEINRRFALTMNLAYEQIFELDLTTNRYYQYFIINGMFEKTAMPEPLPMYLDRTVREHVYQPDIAAMLRFLSMGSLIGLCERNETRTIEYRRLSPKGVPYWCSLLAQGIRQFGRTPSFVMLNICDINDAKQAELGAQEKLRQALRNAERLSEAKSSFTGHMSHEIRTPLNAIMGYMNVARQHYAEPERVLDCLDKADLASKHLLSIVSDILDASALESGRLHLGESPFRLGELVANLDGLYRVQANEAGLDFVIRTRDVTEESLVGDETRIRQILMNLVSNALKFTPRGGHVEVELRQMAVVGEIVNLAIAVRDDGVGMKPEFLAHIFGAYEQEDATTSRAHGGSGLGLSIVKSLCEMMGGTVGVESRKGEGTTFTVHLPLKRLPYDLPQGEERKALQQLRVVTASCDPARLEMLSGLMKRLETRQECYVSGAEAVRALRAAREKGKPHDLLLVDAELADCAQSIAEARALAGDALMIALLGGADAREADAPEGCRLVKRPVTHAALLKLLAEAAHRRDALSPRERDELELRGLRVLLAEDNRLNREIARELLTGMGLEADAAENGQDCVQRFRDAPPGTYALILMDLQMPVMDGFAAARAVRAMRDRPDSDIIPIVALTANAYPSDVNMAIAAGMNAHLPKPIDPDTLLQTIRKFVNA